MTAESAERGTRIRELHTRLRDPLRQCETKTRQLLSELTAPVPDRLYHYTDANGLRGIISGNYLRATDIRFMNDASEITYAAGLCKSLIDARKATATDELEELLGRARNTFDIREMSNIYSVSFSEKPDDVSQWRAYGGTLGGYAIGFDFRILSLPRSMLTATRGMLVKVIYDKQVQEKYLNKILDFYIRSFQSNIGRFDDDMKTFAMAEYSQNIRIALSDLLFSCKNHVYENEAEWRVLAIFPVADDEHQSAVKYRTGPLGMVPYVDYALHAPAGVYRNKLPIEDVVQGPRREPELCAKAIDGFLAKNGFWMTCVKVSEVPLRY